MHICATSSLPFQKKSISHSIMINIGHGCNKLTILIKILPSLFACFTTLPCGTVGRHDRRMVAYEYKKDFDSRNDNIFYVGKLKHYRFGFVKDDDVRSFISLLFLFWLMLIGLYGEMKGSTFPSCQESHHQ
jgi:hypothetical protein